MSDGAFLTKQDIAEAAEQVIQRWMKARLLRFGTHDDGSDDRLLAAEIARVALGEPS